jgi:hypothetical protein
MWFYGCLARQKPGSDTQLLCDQLMVEQDARGRLPLFAHSQMTFLLELAALGPNSVEFRFVPDDRGVVSQLIRRAQGAAEITAIRKER